MTFIKSLMPLFIVGKVLGIVPYRISTSKIASSSFSKFTCFLYIIGYFCLLYATVKDNMRTLEKSVNFHKEVVISRYGANFVAVCTDLIISAFNQDRFLCVNEDIRKFDMHMSKMGHPRRDPLAKYWGYFATTTMYWTISSTVTFITWRGRLPWYEITGVILTFLTLSYGVQRFVAMTILIAQRFQHLNRTILCEMPRVFTVVDRGQRKSSCTIEEVGRIHATLMDAAEGLNNCFGIQLLLWLATLMINYVTGLYLSVTRPFLSVPLTMSLISFIGMLTDVGALNGSCHFLCKQANDLGRILQYPKAKHITQWSSHDERILVKVALLQRPLQISAVGFVNLDLSLILPMVTASITYMTIVLTAKPEHTQPP